MAAQNRRKAEAEETRKVSSSDEEEDSTEENEDLVEDSDTESEGDKKEQPPPKKQVSSLPHHSSSDDDTESDSEIDLPSNSVRKLAPEVKPPVSSIKPMVESSQAASKKARSKPPSDSQPSGLSSKRPADSPAPQKGKDSKRAKKKEQGADFEAVEEEKKTVDDTKKQLFQRFWSEDDELVILKGLIEHAENQGINPSSVDMTSFYDFIRKSLHTEASKSQLTEKIRRMKKKFLTNLKKGKNGDDRTFSKAHDQSGYDLSKKIWGIESNGSFGADSVKGDKKGTKAIAIVKKANASVKKPNLGSPLEKSLPTDKAKEVKNVDMEVDQAVVAAAAAPSSAEPFYRQTIDSSLEKEIKIYGSELITGAKKLELDDKLRQLKVKEIEVYLQQLDYKRYQAVLVLEALKSPAH